MNQLIPSEQSGFRPGCLLPTRVLSIYQEVDNIGQPIYQH